MLLITLSLVHVVLPYIAVVNVHFFFLFLFFQISNFIFLILFFFRYSDLLQLVWRSLLFLYTSIIECVYDENPFSIWFFVVCWIHFFLEHFFVYIVLLVSLLALSIYLSILRFSSLFSSSISYIYIYIYMYVCKRLNIQF